MNGTNDLTRERTTTRESGGSDRLVNSSRMPQQEPMRAARLTYARSLRAIGHSLETFGIRSFELKKAGDEYLVRVTTREPKRKAGRENNLVKRVVQMVWRRRYDGKEPAKNLEVAEQLRYLSSDICYLDEDGKSRRGQSDLMPDAQKPSQVLRVVGAYLDRTCSRAFTISMSTRSVSVWYENGVGARNWQSFDMSNLYDRAIHMLLARAKNGDDLSSVRRGSLSP